MIPDKLYIYSLKKIELPTPQVGNYFQLSDTWGYSEMTKSLKASIL
jgi:hypothetical protein